MDGLDLRDRKEENSQGFISPISFYYQVHDFQLALTPNCYIIQDDLTTFKETFHRAK